MKTRSQCQTTWRCNYRRSGASASNPLLRWLRTANGLIPVVLIAWLTLLPASASAVGVPAGTPIQNQAFATYTVGTTPLTAQSLPTSFSVDEIIDIDVSLQTGPVPVGPNDTNQVLTYLVTNTGNGVEVWEFDPNNALGGDNFDPVFASIYLDGNGDGLFNVADDTLYTKGADDPTLDANDPTADSITVFLLNDIPGTATDGQSGFSRLTATSVGVGAQAPGYTVSNGGDGGLIDAVVGSTGAQDAEDGTYIVSAASVALSKTWTIVPHATFGTQPVPGATIQYDITVTVTGAGIAENLVITDLVPADTIYENNSLILTDGSGTNLLTDAADLDAGDFDVSLSGGITVDLGDVAGGSADSTITFNVMIDPN